MPSETKARPGATAPTPMAEAALSPPPPATTTPASRPQRLAISARMRPETAEPSTSAGIWSRPRPVFASSVSDQSRAPVSSQLVPAASEGSDTASPVSHRRR